MRSYPSNNFFADLVTFPEEILNGNGILNGNFHFLYSACF